MISPKESSFYLYGKQTLSKSLRIRRSVEHFYNREQISDKKSGGIFDRRTQQLHRGAWALMMKINKTVSTDIIIL